jgi:hypothetical protein
MVAARTLLAKFSAAEQRELRRLADAAKDAVTSTTRRADCRLRSGAATLRTSRSASPRAGVARN